MCVCVDGCLFVMYVFIEINKFKKKYLFVFKYKYVVFLKNFKIIIIVINNRLVN